LRHVYVGDEERGVRDMEVASAAPCGALVKMRFAGVEDRAAASRLAGGYLLIPTGEAAPLPGGRPYIFHLIGLRVESRAGDDLGVITGVLENPGNDVWVARCPAGEYLIPAVDAFVLDIDLAAGRVVIDPVPGLLPE
jgi:16S rRNA processing protein RimM